MQGSALAPIAYELLGSALMHIFLDDGFKGAKCASAFVVLPNQWKDESKFPSAIKEYFDQTPTKVLNLNSLLLAWRSSSQQR